MSITGIRPADLTSDDSDDDNSSRNNSSHDDELDASVVGFFKKMFLNLCLF